MLPPNIIHAAIETAAIERDLALRKQARIERHRPSEEPRERSFRLARIVTDLFSRRPSATPVAVTADQAGR
jgi:hypothetical protein